MANQFCSQCGAKLLPNSSFCAECGARQKGASAAHAPAAAWQRYTPFLVVVAVVVVLAAVVIVGTMHPNTTATVARRGNSQTAGEGGLPEGHPPIVVPEEAKQAIRELSKQAATAPEDIALWERLAELQYRTGQLDPAYLAEAETSYRHILAGKPDHLEALRSLGNVAFDQQKPDTAIDFYQRYLKLKPDDPDVQTDLGTMLLSSGKADEAIQQFQSVVQQHPAFFQAQFNLAIAYSKAGQHDKVIEALEKARTLASDDRTRNQVEQVLAQVKSAPAPEAAGSDAAPSGSQPSPAPAPVAATFQEGMDASLRQYPIIGPKIERIEWTGAQTAKVYLREFPMDQMPADMTTMFTDRIRARIKEQKDAHKVTQQSRLELIDNASGKMMTTITE
jgi:tetratricopeptide (TPR) repeat protein